MIAELSMGTPLPAVLSSAGFPSFYVATIGVAEYYGDLGRSFRMVGEWYGRIDRLKRDLVRKLSYPLFLLLSAVLLLLFFIIVILPKFEALFRTFQGKIPPTTNFLLSFSHWMGENGLFLIPLLLFFFLALFLLYRRLRGAGLLYRTLFRLPLFGDLLRTFFTLRLSSQLGLLLEAGLGIQESLRAIGERIGGIEFRAMIRQMEDHLLEGAPLSAFQPPDPLVKKEFFQLAALGESMGTLGEQLTQYALFLEEELQHRAERIVRWVEPFTLLFLGGILSFLILSIFLPLFQVMQSI